MRFLSGSLLLALVVSGCSDGAGQQPVAPAETTALLARYHFIGATALAAETNATKLTNIWALPSSLQFASNTLNKVAGSLRSLAHFPESAAASHAEELRPILEEWLRAESCGEWRATSTGALAVILAVRLPQNRADAWSATLARIAADWMGAPTTALSNAGRTGWQSQKSGSPRVFKFARAADWVVLGIGEGKLAMFDAAVDRAAHQAMPLEITRGGWLTATADLPALAQRAGMNAPVRLGEIQISLFGRREESGDTNVRCEGRIRYDRALDMKLPEWQWPMKLINDPLTGFTAVRGLDGLLTNTDWMRDSGFTNTISQATWWAMSQVPFQVFWATPLLGPSNLLASLEPKLNTVASNNLPKDNTSKFKYADENASLHWEGLPVVIPFALPIQSGSQAFLHGGFFVNPSSTNPAPQELFDVIQSRTNTLYYDWEITQDRLTAWRHFSQLACLIAGRPQAAESDPGWQWLPQIAPLLGNTVTEVMRTSPTELKFTRRGDLGLTGAELTLLVRTIDSKGFPLSWWDWLKPDPAAVATGTRPSTNAPARNP